MTSAPLHLAMQFHADLRDWDDGRPVAEALFQEAPLAPERAAVFEDATRSREIAVTRADDLAPLWARTGTFSSGDDSYRLPLEVNWRRWSAPALTGTLQFATTDRRGKPIPGQLRLTVKAGKEAGPALVRLFDRLFVILRPEAGLLHRLGAANGAAGPDDPVARTAAADFAAGIPWSRQTVGPLNTKVEGRSDLGWCGVVPTASIRDRDALRAEADLLETGSSTRIRFGPDPVADDDPSAFERRRSRVKDALEEGVFLVP